MTRRAVAIGALLWLALASSIAAGIVAGSLISAATVRAAVEPIAGSGAPRQLDGRPDGPEPSPSLWWPGTPTGKRPAARLAPAAAMTPAGTTTPAPARALPAAGVASWYAAAPTAAAAGPALRAALGPGWRGSVVTVAGPAGSAKVVLSDWCACYRGSPRERIVDLPDEAFVAACGPLSLGLCRVTLEVLP